MEKDDSHAKEYKQFFEYYKKFIDIDSISITSNQDQIKFPHFSASDIQMITIQASKLFEQDPILLDLQSPIYVVGDIHGQILDLLRVFHCHGLPDQQKYLFLGDIVDRGEFSIECCLLIFILKILYPTNIFLIRGNHESETLSQQFGFLVEIFSRYPGECLFPYFLSLFNNLPLAAIIDKAYFCVHGGIGPNFHSLSQISSLSRPITQSGLEIYDTLLWSDPCINFHRFAPSTRGLGYFFGVMATVDFCQKFGFKAIIRGHECVSDGVQFLFKKRVITVFTASNYCNIVGNKSGVLFVDSANTQNPITPFQYPALPDFRIGNIQFDQIPQIFSGPIENIEFSAYTFKYSYLNKNPLISFNSASNISYDMQLDPSKNCLNSSSFNHLKFRVNKATEPKVIFPNQYHELSEPSSATVIHPNFIDLTRRTKFSNNFSEGPRKKRIVRPSNGNNILRGGKSLPPSICVPDDSVVPIIGNFVSSDFSGN